jgi:hypothetical protein
VTKGNATVTRDQVEEIQLSLKPRPSISAEGWAIAPWRLLAFGLASVVFWGYFKVRAGGDRAVASD